MAAPAVETLDTTKADHAHRTHELRRTTMPAVLRIGLIMPLSAAPDTACWFQFHFA